MRSLRERLSDVPQVGEVTWLGVRPEHDAPMIPVSSARLLEGRGVEGDVAARASRPGGKRNVTLVQAEHLAVISALVGAGEGAPARAATAELLRRNVVVRGINLLSLAKLAFEIGDTLLEGTGPCAPCAKMDDALGPGGFQAMRGHGGITARVLRGGVIAIGARVRVHQELP